MPIPTEKVHYYEEAINLIPIFEEAINVSNKNNNWEHFINTK